MDQNNLVMENSQNILDGLRENQLENKIENISKVDDKQSLYHSDNNQQHKFFQSQVNKIQNKPKKQLEQFKNQQIKQISEKYKNKQTLKQVWKPYDFLFPGGRLAKLVKIFNVYKKNLPIYDTLKKLKLTQTSPVVNFIGAMQSNLTSSAGRGKFLAGISRACYNTDAIIVDNGIFTGIQKFTMRKNVKLIGVSPQSQIKFPKINPTVSQPYQLSNGHTHIYLVSNKIQLDNRDGDLSWGGQIYFKIDLCKKLAEGRSGNPNCKILCILFAQNPNLASIQQLTLVLNNKQAVQNQFPIIVLPGSKLCNSLISYQQGGDIQYQIKQLVQKGHFFYCTSNNSEDIAQLVHFLLTVRPW